MQIEPTEYLNEKICGEVLGGLGEGGGVDVEDGALVCSGGVEILEKVADDFNFNDSDI